MDKHKNYSDQNSTSDADEVLEQDTAPELTEQQIDEEIAETEVESDVEELQTQISKLREDYLRAFADAENTKRRCAQEIEKNNKYAIASFAKSLLAVADNLHRAIEAVNKEESKPECEALLKGIELTEAELMKAFNKFGVTKMEILGQIFDPNFHQAIQEVEDASKPVGTVIAELQTGYMLNDRLLREAMVVVTKGGSAA